MVLAIILMPLGILLGITKVLVTRLDLLNSILAGAAAVFMIRNMGLEARTTWTIFLVTIAIAFVLQHMFKIGKIILGIWGCMAVGILCYLFRDSCPYNVRLMSAGIGMVIAAVMNAVFWVLEK
ncbi:MAG: hypothetical protein J5959_02185 [Butyrivibrio sp.]|nr:hypothetical protein [Butyrivibrio sp.]